MDAPSAIDAENDKEVPRSINRIYPDPDVTVITEKRIVQFGGPWPHFRAHALIAGPKPRRLDQPSRTAGALEPRMNKKIKFDPRRLAVVDGGNGDPAIFVHGFGSNKSTWRDVCHGLKDVFSYYAIDLPGSGDSPAPRHFQYTLEHFADVLTDFVVMKDLKNLTLVGASLGATVILLAVLRNRDELAPRVRALCLIGPVAYPQAFPLFFGVLRMPFLGPLALNVPLVRGLLSAAVSALPDALPPPQYSQYYARKNVREALIKTARLISADSLARYVRRLKSIEAPTLVLWGRRDRVVPLRFGRRLARELPNAQLTIIDHCGHAPHKERPDEVITALKVFAQNAGAPRPELP
jgi:pimeloyl-ACP methyl ester carboxylesterase